jgi:hypothetical protein
MDQAIRSPEEKVNTEPDTTFLTKKLKDLGYIGLFNRLDMDALDSIWNERTAPESLEKITIDLREPDEIRFLAAEILFYKKQNFPPQNTKKQLAAIYANALVKNFTRIINAWGMPGFLDGLAGKHFVAIGEAAIPELIKLLDNDKELIYSGSKEATVGNKYRYRIKDFAAFYISIIRNIPIMVYESPQARDKEIDKLKGYLR